MLKILFLVLSIGSAVYVPTVLAGCPQCKIPD